MGEPVTGLFIDTIRASDGVMERDEFEGSELDAVYDKEQYIYVRCGKGLLAVYNLQELVSLRVERFV